MAGTPALTTSQAATGDRNIDGLLSGDKWIHPDLTFTFATSASQYGANYGPETTAANWQGSLSAAAQASVRKAFAAIASFTDLTFKATTDFAHANLRFAQSADAAPTAFAYYPDGFRKSGDVWVSTNYPPMASARAAMCGSAPTTPSTAIPSSAITAR
jgi:serralysin